MNGIKEQVMLVLSWAQETLVWWAFLHWPLTLAWIAIGKSQPVERYPLGELLATYFDLIPDDEVFLFSGPTAVWFGHWLLTGRVRILPWKKVAVDE